ncbi:TonB-dependent receptor [Sphingobium chlorophenolicum]|nr:TonB-dependent receptor [Sphingobium chlorophenolicum]
MRYGGGLLTGVAISLIVSPAWSQDAGQGVKADEGGLGEIVVTATKRPEKARDVPISITALDSAQLKKRAVTNVADVVTAIPGVAMDESGQARSTPIIRGIASNTRNAGVESGVSVYVDGVYTGRPETFNQALEDATAIEVLQGPQGTLFGKNSIAGAISVTTADPAFNWSGSVKGRIGNLSDRQIGGTVNAPIIDDTVALRLSGFYNDRDGFVKNLNGGPDQGSKTEYGFRGKMLLKGSDNFKAVLAFDYSREKDDYYYGENRSGTASNRPNPKPVTAPGPFTVNVDPGIFYRQLWGSSLTLNYEPADGYEVTSITAYRHNKFYAQDDQDWEPADLIAVDFRDSQSQFSQEIRLKSPDDKPFRYVAGVYYFSQDSDTNHTGILGRDFAVPGLVAPGERKYIAPLGSVATRSYAAYIDASYAITRRLTFLAGLRVTHETKRVNFQVITDAAAQPLFYAIPLQADTQKQTDLSPTAGLRYAITDTANVYFRYARGYKSGGWNIDFASRSAAGAPTIQSLRFKPETLDNFEIGLKGDFFNRHLRTNVSAYVMKYDDLQVTQFFGFNGGAITSNAAKATIKGVVGDASLLLTRGLTIGGNVGYNDAQYDNYAGASSGGANADGNRLPGPKWTAAGNVDYNLSLGDFGSLDFWGEVSYRGGQYTDPLNLERLKIPGRTIVNASVTLTPADDRWSASLWARNLFDKTYIAQLYNDTFAFRGTTDEIVSYALPRTWGLTVGYKF